tara:strand:+ start:414 stop:578 length:165 start_codon:yes stop_codon:yes gene_type:complete
MYQLMFNEIKQQVTSIKKVDGTVVTMIPMSEDNTDYQKYLEWVAQGNTPTPADS